MCQEWADESIPVQPRSARGKRPSGAVTPGRAYVRTPATPRADGAPAMEPSTPAKDPAGTQVARASSHAPGDAR